MPNPIAALPMAVSTVSSIVSGNQAKKQANAAAASQENQARAAISDQQAREAEIKKLLEPYIQTGAQSLEATRSLMGLTGPEQQQQAIAALQTSPEFLSLIQQGENAMLQNASATGGLRGGNIQQSMMQFRPQVLSELINRQYGRLGDLTRLGQNSVLGQAAQSQNTGAQIASQFSNIGRAQAGANLTPGATLGGVGAVQNISGQFTGGGIENFLNTGKFFPS